MDWPYAFDKVVEFLELLWNSPSALRSGAFRIAWDPTSMTSETFERLVRGRNSPDDHDKPGGRMYAHESLFLPLSPDTCRNTCTYARDDEYLFTSFCILK